jgi:predicted O-linked N-acetylglucosamine transferase (SPINDLY family)
VADVVRETMTVEEAFNSAMQRHQAGQLAEAEALYRQVLSAQPNHTDALHRLGMLASQLRRHDLALEFIRRAISIRPNAPEFYLSAGAALDGLGRFDEAISCYRSGLAVRPGRAQAIQLFNHLANSLRQIDKLEESADCYRQMLALDAASLQAWNNLGNTLHLMGQIEEAAAAFRRALAINPAFFPAHNNLGNILQVEGRISEAVASYERAMQFQPQNAALASNRLFALHHLPEYDPMALLREHRAWDEQFAKPLRNEIKPHADDRSPDRRLRIGYVSTDFRDHVAGWSMLALLSAHDRTAFEIYCYSGVERPDVVTDSIRACASAWRDVARLTDERLAAIIRDDRIDILVDLSLHSAGNRLLAFARKPAPVQVNYLGYAGTTGMEAMDYRFSDPQLDPPDADTRCYSETTVRLPDCYWCYQPPRPTPPPSELPAEKNGYVTFGCLNNFSKVSAPVLKLWQRLMREVPTSKLLLYCPARPKRQAVEAEFSAAGIDPRRLEFADRVQFEKYMETYHRIDIALDPFPYGGAITTCDSLWMGVPVVTLAGRTAVGRAGLSVVTTVGLAELAARSEEEYIAIAAKLAADLPRLAQMRRSLRGRMENSPLTDKNRFARNVEAAYRQMWRTWCEKQ